MRILIAEDDDVSRMVLEAMLQEQGHEVVATKNGLQALQSFQENFFAVIITDWLMPVMNGLELAQEIRKIRRNDYTYIIMLTSLGGTMNYREAINAGVDDFITKPVDDDQLICRIHVAERILGLCRQIVREVTGQELARVALAESENRFHSLFESMAEGVALNRVIVDAEGKAVDYEIIAVNPAHEKHTRLSLAQVIGRRASEIYQVYEPPLLHVFSEVARTGVPKTFEMWFSPLQRHFAISISSSSPDTFVTIFTDITERKVSERRIRQLSRAVEQSPNTVIITDTAGNIEYVNPKFSSVTGYSFKEAVGRNPRFLKSGKTPPEVYRTLWKTIVAGQEWHGELQGKKKNGDIYWESASISSITDKSGRISHYLAVTEDITERKKRDENVIRSQRLESIGELASGIAHDLNNILAPIMMSASVLREEQFTATCCDLVTMIEQAAARGADIVRQLLTFARGVEGDRVVLKSEAVVGQVAHIIRQTFPKSINFQISAQEGVWCIMANLTQLQQVLLNLCLNARDAMPSGGKLLLSAENCDFSGGQPLPDPGAKPGRYVKLEVVDSGTGIPADVIDKVFDPFFTTKELGKGTGLGLSTALGIVRSHNGFVTVYSEPGKGAAFQVYIPATVEALRGARETTERPAAKGNGELILVVDDEPGIRSITEKIIKRNGYEVITAANGVEALKIYSDNSSCIKLLVTDLMMPLMDGAKLTREIKEINPRLPIIVASGYCDATTESEMQALGVAMRLAKPYGQDQLLSAIHETISRQLPTPGQPVLPVKTGIATRQAKFDCALDMKAERYANHR